MHNGYFAISVIDSWGTCSYEPGTILSTNAVYTGVLVIIMLQKVNKQEKEKLRILISIR